MASDDPRALEPWATPPQFRTTPEGIADRIRGRQARTSVPLATPADPTGGVAPGFLRTVPPPQQVLPPNGVDFNRGGSLSGATSATTGTGLRVGAAAYTVPQGSIAYLKGFDVQVNGLLPTSDISFALRVDGGALTGWDDLFILPANVAVYSKTWGPDEIYLEIPPAKTFDIAVIVRDGGTYDIGASFHGWTVSQQTAEAFAAGWGL